MIYDLSALKNKYNDYSNISQKISLETKKGNLVRIRRGLYSPDIVNVCYGLSYSLFEYVLFHYGLIPEYVSLFTSSCLI